jgi:hypothetical protein
MHPEKKSLLNFLIEVKKNYIEAFEERLKDLKISATSTALASMTLKKTEVITKFFPI